MTDSFGTIVARWQVEQAILSTLQAIPPSPATAPTIVYYLAEVERQMGLSPRTLPLPPGPNSYRGGTDGVTMMAEWLPMIHAIAQPIGKVEYLDRYTAAQPYKLQMLCTVGDDDEDMARMIADAYGAAVARALLDFGALGGLASGTMLTAAPSVAPLDARDARQVMRSSLTLETLIAPVFTVGAPSVWTADPYAPPAAEPQVQTVTTTVTAQPIG